MVKSIFFQAAQCRKRQMAAGRNLPSKQSSGNDKAADGKRPRGCAVVPASFMPRGFFAVLPIGRGRLQRGKQTQPVSFVEKAGQAGPSAYAAAYGRVQSEMQEAMLQRSKTKGACAALPSPLPQTHLSVWGTVR
ncbi:hypothetical protein P9273_08160 [Mesorhizobium sp. WSM4935]|uniref:hypothetical protein n=1 Tax=Mesorhizobium sp. WSM4935 TaxID=3038547 RepID=UPI0024156F52|nr:hypothetical protein [Mesorhizobium sp. WSM4935]MDG4875069.1 hypothetical protein [Mesorhizobium sp. WSM4935]